METVTEDYFEPCCRWKRGKDYDTIHIELDGFKIEDVKARLKHVEEHRYEISITAESPRRLKKAIEILGDYYNLEQIRALFSNGNLNLELPKKGNKFEISMPRLEIKKTFQEATEDMKNQIVSAAQYSYSKANIAAVGLGLMASGLFAYKYYTECYGF
ncbi:Detected protein of unknown function [Hibiscus syriacus]|uniref:SHSP domain-containing protein n=1 Tax=Hibiscus syriacus TaxID=106335 RepID=A0A6A2YYQ1_HIBSY|nr:uncharacterized protein LOC120153968 [Hibiscus syriacus]KAE8684731.1 Detected protein of unknown function [Hibiscus syriacus]